MKDVARKMPLRTLLISGLFVLMVLIGHTAYWLHNTVYDTERFTAVATDAITAESSRQSIGSAIVDRALADRPIVRQTVGPRLSQMIAALLGTDIASNAINTIIERSHLLVTTPQREPITLNTTTIKQQIATLQSAIGSDEESKRLDVSKIPDEVMILDTAKLPNIHQYGIAALWVGVVSIVAIVCSAAWYIYRAGSGAARLTRIRLVLVLLAISSIIALLVGPLTKPVILTVAASAPEQTLLRNLFDGFIAPFNRQAVSVGLVALVGLGLSAIVPGRIPATAKLSSKPSTPLKKTKAKQ